MSGAVTTDGSVTWSPPVSLSEGITLSLYPAIAADSAGNLHAVWGEETGTVSNRRQFIRYARYDAADGRWQLPAVRIFDVPMLLNSIDPANVTPRLAVREEEGRTEVCVVWHGYRAGDPERAEEVWISCSVDGGASWATPRNVSRSPAVVSIMPRIAFDADGRLHVVWEERTRTEDTDVYYEIFYCYGLNRTVFLPIVLRRWR